MVKCGPPRMLSPSIVSKLSSSHWPATRSGKYQPFGGAGRRSRLRPSRSPWRPQDVADGADRGQRLEALLLEVSMDGRCAVLAQGASFFEPPASGKDPLLGGAWGAARLLRSRRTILPVEPVDAFSLGASDPILDGGERDAEGACDGLHGLSASDGSDHLSPLFCGEFFEP